MVKGPEQTLLQGGQTDGPQTYEKMLNITSHEMQIKTTKRYHLIPVRMAVTNKSTNSKMWRKRNPRSILVGMQTGTTTVENSLEFPQKTKNGTAL